MEKKQLLEFESAIVWFTAVNCSGHIAEQCQKYQCFWELVITVVSSLTNTLCTVLYRLAKIIIFHYFIPEIEQKSQELLYLSGKPVQPHFFVSTGIGTVLYNIFMICCAFYLGLPFLPSSALNPWVPGPKQGDRNWEEGNLWFDCLGLVLRVILYKITLCRAIVSLTEKFNPLQDFMLLL